MKVKEFYKKHPVRNTILAVLLAIVLAVGGALAAQAISAATKAARMREQLSLGTRYLEELDYGSALVCFNKVLNIEYRSVPAYIGAALACEGAQTAAGNAQAAEEVAAILEQGVENTGDAFLISLQTANDNGCWSSSA